MKAIENSPVHGTAVAVDGWGFLILGASGSGKSGLALNMMALGAELIADDQVILQRSEDTVQMRAPAAICGMIEAHSVGLLAVPVCETAVLHHVVDMDSEAEARLPQLQTCDVLGVQIDLINGRNVPSLPPTLLILGRSGRHS